MIRWHHSQWAPEIRALNRWARWCVAGNTGEIMRVCGLTWAGSPQSIMFRLWELGAPEASDAYERPDYDAHVPDYQSMDIDAWMWRLRESAPAQYAGVLARHGRVVDGTMYMVRAEGWIAQVLYCRGLRHSRRRLAQDCERAYRALRDVMAVYRPFSTVRRLV